MPTVPKYQPISTPQPSVRQAGIPTIRQDAAAPIEAFGGGGEGVVRATGNLTKGVVDIANDEIKKADQLVVLNAKNKLSEHESKLQSEILSYRGKNVFEMPDKIQEKWKKGIEEISKELNNDNQRLSFKNIEVSTWDSLNSNMQRHMGSEKEKYDTELTNSYLANEQNAAKAGDPDRIAKSISNQVATIVDHANRYGLPKEWTDQKTAEATSKTHSSVINQYLSQGNDLSASGYYKINKEFLTTSDRTAVEKAIEEGSTRGESMRNADSIWDKSGGDLKKALEQARKIEDPKVRDMTEQRLEKKMSVQKTIEAEAQKDAYQRAGNILDKGGSIDDIPPSEWSFMTNEQKNALRNRFEDPPNDDHLYLQFRDIPPTALAQMSRADFESNYWAKFDKAHRARAIELWDAAKDAEVKSALDPKLTTTVSFNDIVKRSADTAGIVSLNKTTAKYSKSEARRFAEFEMSVAEEVKNFETIDLQGKRKASITEIQSIADRVVVKSVFNKKGSVDVGDTRIVTDNKGRATVPLKDVPENLKIRFVRDFKTGRNLSNEKIGRAYAAYLLGDIKLYNSIVNE